MRVKKKYLIEWLLIILSGILIYFLVDNDAFLYKDTVAQIVSVTNSKGTKTEDTYKNKDYLTRLDKYPYCYFWYKFQNIFFQA